MYPLHMSGDLFLCHSIICGYLSAVEMDHIAVTVFTGRYPEYVFERPREVKLVFIAYLTADIADGYLAVLQKLRRLVHPVLDQE